MKLGGSDLKRKFEWAPSVLLELLCQEPTLAECDLLDGVALLCVDVVASRDFELLDGIALLDIDGVASPASKLDGIA